MSILNSSIVPVGASSDYAIDKSLRFNDDSSSYLNRTPSSDGNRKTWTWSGWVKRANLGGTDRIFGAGSDNSNRLIIHFLSSGEIKLYSVVSGAQRAVITTNMVFRDTSAWYHLIFQMDATNTSFKIFVNGAEVTTTVATAVANVDHKINSTDIHKMGSSIDGNVPFDGYLADVHFLDGHAVNPDTFGEFNKYGQWVAKTPTFANPSFDDGSDSNLKVDLFGDVQTTVGKYGQGFAFDGSGDYLYAGSNVGVGTGDFTLELWVNPTAGANTGSYHGLFNLHHLSGANRIETAIHTGTIHIYTDTSTWRNTGFAIPTDTWTHIAFQKTGGYLKMFANGVEKWSVVNTQDYGAGSDYFRFGYHASYYTGSADDLRFSTVARYSASGFTPPTRRLTSDANTKLLLNGDQVTIAEGKFSDGMVFDGTDDYINVNKDLSSLLETSTIAGLTHTFCFWEKSTGNTDWDTAFGVAGSSAPWFQIGAYNNKHAFYKANGWWDTGVLRKADVWEHNVVRFNGTSCHWFVNGVQIASFTSSNEYIPTGNFRIGRHSSGDWMKGTLKEMSIYSSVLSASDITSLYNKGVPVPATDVQESSLEAYYPLNETNGSSVFDNSTNSNHGTVHGAAPSTYGKNGFHLDFNPVDPDALYFDGSNDYVSLATGALDSLNGSSGFSISAFIKVSSDTTDDGYYAMGAATGDGDWFWNQRPVGTDFWVAAKTVSGSTVHSIPNPLKGEIGKWVHLVTTYVSGSLKTYKNGVLIDTYTSNTGNVVLGASSGVYLGSYGTGAYGGLWTMQGNMEEVAVYNSTLTQANVEALYNDGNPADANTVSSSSLVGYWKLNEGVGTNVSDSAKWTAFEGATFGGTGSRINSNTDILGNQSDFTIQTWIKPSSSQVNYADILGNHYDDGTTERGFVIQQYAGLTNQYEVGGAYTGDPALNWANGSLTRFSLTAGSWQHLVITKSNGGNVKVYINGVLDKNITDSGYSGATQTSPIPFKLGEGWVDNQRNFNGQLKEFAIWHTVLTAANVTSLYNSGTPIDATDISGTKMYWKLDEGPSQSGNGYVKDSSGENKGGAINIARFEGTNHNNGTITGASWTVANVGNDKNGNNNFTLNNLGIEDQVLDTPNNNFPTWNPLDDCNLTLSEGNLKQTHGSSYAGARASMAFPKTGKWYAEYMESSTAGSNVIGSFRVVGGGTNLDNNGGPNEIYWGSSGITLGGGGTWYTSFYVGSGSVLQMAYDADTGKTWVGHNNTWYRQSGSTLYSDGNPAGGTNQTNTWAANDEDTFLSIWSYSLNGVGNFGQDSSFAGTKTAQGKQDSNDIGDFYYTPPTGFLALCTKNLPEPTVIPSKHFNTVLWNGTSNSTLAITDVGFKPDFVWIKSRSTAYGHNHALFDSVRGISKGLVSNSTNSEYTVSGVTSFDSDGFTLGSDNAAGNEVGFTYAGWNWKANGAGVANTDGDINSTVSANVSAGFSIVSYIASGSNTDTVGHGLSEKLDMVITKNRDGVRNWHVGVVGLPFTSSSNSHHGYVSLNGQVASSPDNGGRANIPNTTTFQGEGGNGDKYIAYCFHSVDGYSKVGIYIGNGNADGTFVHTGFKPAYVMIKTTETSTDNWWVGDNKRDVGNTVTQIINPNNSNAEYTTGSNFIDFVSNGFKIRGTGGDVSRNGHKLIYIAFAETPFKYSNAR